MSFIDLMSQDRWTKADIAARLDLLVVAGRTTKEAKAEGVAAEIDAAKLHKALDVEAAQREVDALKLASGSAILQPETQKSELPEGLAIPFSPSAAGPREPSLAEQLAAAEERLADLLADVDDELASLLGARKPVLVVRE